MCKVTPHATTNLFTVQKCKSKIFTFPFCDLILLQIISIISFSASNGSVFWLAKQVSLPRLRPDLDCLRLKTKSPLTGYKSTTLLLPSPAAWQVRQDSNAGHRKQKSSLLLYNNLLFISCFKNTCNQMGLQFVRDHFASVLIKGLIWNALFHVVGAQRHGLGFL